MSAPKRARACDACHSIKIKCELGTTGGPGPCARCVRLEKECTVTPPRRQKDRVAELEAQVEALTKLLKAQNIQTPPDNETTPPRSQDEEEPSSLVHPSATGTTTAKALPQKKRRLDDVSYVSESTGSETTAKDRTVKFDTIISQDIQRQMLDKYFNEIMPTSPFVPLSPDWTYEKLRNERPILLEAILYSASAGMLPIEVQEDMARIVLDLFALMTIAEGKKSLELIQAIHVVTLWYRTPKHHTHVAAFQLIQLAAGLAEDIGIGGPQCSPSLGYVNTGEEITQVEAWRTWLVSHLLTTNMRVFMRRPTPQNWTEYDEFTLTMLGYSEHSLPTDRLLCQFIRAERLCEKIASQLDFCNFSVASDMSDPAVHVTMQGLKNLVTDWKAQIPMHIRCGALTFWEHAITLYLHEAVLHTVTNKQSFAAPFLAERLSVTDFPTPVVTQQHIESILALKTATHALLDLTASLDVPYLMALPSLIFASRIAYAEYILVKLYIASAGPGNTFGAFLDPASLLVDEYLDKMINLSERVKEVDVRCALARILASATRLKEFVNSYKASGLPLEFNWNTVDNFPTLPGADVGSYAPVDWNNLDLFDNSLGLDDIFADPPSWDMFSNVSQNGGLQPSVG